MSHTPRSFAVSLLQARALGFTGKLWIQVDVLQSSQQPPPPTRLLS